MGSVGRQRGTAGHRCRAGERRPGGPRQPGPAAADPSRRRPGPLLCRPDGAGHRRSTTTSTATHTSVWSSRTTLPPTCTTGTAATCTSRPMSSNRWSERNPTCESRVTCTSSGRSSSLRGLGRESSPVSWSASGRSPTSAVPEDARDVITCRTGSGRRNRQHLPRRRRIRSRGDAPCRGRSLADARVRFVDYGIRGMHLAYDLLDGWDALVLVDALPSRGSPGTLHVFEADHEASRTTAGLDAHGMDPAAVFASLVALGGTPPPTVVDRLRGRRCRGGHRAVPAVAAAVPEAADADKRRRRAPLGT